MTRKTGLVVPVDVDPDEPLNKMRWLSAISPHNFENIMHGQPQTPLSLPKRMKNRYKNLDVYKKLKLKY
ncbi:MAG TPA: hypothetical protein EYH00_04035 [Archaeoglobus profundus]|nr:hypothetical protein [Archaeoglobus profundus]